MKKKVIHIYNRVLRSLHTHTNLSMKQIMSSRRTTAVLCRVVMITTLLNLGISEPTIRDTSGLSQQRINYIKNNTAKRHANLLEMRVLERKVWNDVRRYKREED